MKNILPTLRKRKPTTPDSDSTRVPSELQPPQAPQVDESFRKRTSGFSCHNNPGYLAQTLSGSPRSFSDDDELDGHGDSLNRSAPSLRQLRVYNYNNRKRTYFGSTASRSNLSSYSFSGDTDTVRPRRDVSFSSPIDSPTCEILESPMVDQEDIIALTRHVRSFSDALNVLRNIFVENEGHKESADDAQSKAHEQLGEVLSILKGVLGKYPNLNSTEILTCAGIVINKVKTHNYESAEEPSGFYEATDQLALAFSSSVSDFLMGDQDTCVSPNTGQTEFSGSHERSFENFQGHNGELGDEDDAPNEIFDDNDYFDTDSYRSDRAGSEESLDKNDERYDSGKLLPSVSSVQDDRAGDNEADKASRIDLSIQRADELDRALLNMESSVDLSLQRTKVWSKYGKDILNYMERRAHIETDYCKQLAKLAQSTKASISEESYLPFQSTFVTALEYDLEYASNAQSVFQQQFPSKITEQLVARRTEHDRRRSKIKDIWSKECKKLQDSKMNLKRAKSMYIQKQQELEKFLKQLEEKGNKDESSSSSGPSFKIGKKKTEEDVSKKAEESERDYKQCVAEANHRQKELDKTKANVLLELRQLVYQCDMTMKAVTCAYFQMMKSLAAPHPIQYQTLADSSKQYEVGTQFAEFVRFQQSTSKLSAPEVFSFEAYKADDRPDTHRSFSSPADLLLSSTSPDGKASPLPERRRASITSATSETSLHRPPSPNAENKKPRSAWGNTRGSYGSDDTESVSSRSLPASPSGSPTLPKKELSAPSGHGRLSLEAEDDIKKIPQGPFRNVSLSDPAKSHAFKKLRSPSKCKKCESYVYFNGAECEKCGITCHKKCLETLAIRCGYKRLPRKMTTFGVDFHKHLEATSRHDIPILVEKCIEEIDDRGLETKGIYRVSGVKSKVERLCQQFETGADLVDLSSTPPHLIASVLKLYLRQLPEPLMTFDLYQELIEIAKDSSRLQFGSSDSLDESNEENDQKCEEILKRLHESIKKLPHANFFTVRSLLKHLRRVADNCEFNQMPVNNLAIVLGPTLLKPRGTANSLPALMDMPHQARAVELMINNTQIFDDFDVGEGKKETPIETFHQEPRQRKTGRDSILIERESLNEKPPSQKGEKRESVLSLADEFKQEVIDLMDKPNKQKETGFGNRSQPRSFLPGMTGNDEVDLEEELKDLVEGSRIQLAQRPDNLKFKDKSVKENIPETATSPESENERRVSDVSFGTLSPVDLPDASFAFAPLEPTSKSVIPDQEDRPSLSVTTRQNNTDKEVVKKDNASALSSQLASQELQTGKVVSPQSKDTLLSPEAMILKPLQLQPIVDRTMEIKSPDKSSPKRPAVRKRDSSDLRRSKERPVSVEVKLQSPLRATDKLRAEVQELAGELKQRTDAIMSEEEELKDLDELETKSDHGRLTPSPDFVLEERSASVENLFSSSSPLKIAPKVKPKPRSRMSSPLDLTASDSTDGATPKSSSANCGTKSESVPGDNESRTNELKSGSGSSTSGSQGSLENMSAGSDDGFMLVEKSGFLNQPTFNITVSKGKSKSNTESANHKLSDTQRATLPGKPSQETTNLVKKKSRDEIESNSEKSARRTSAETAKVKDRSVANMSQLIAKFAGDLQPPKGSSRSARHPSAEDAASKRLSVRDMLKQFESTEDLQEIPVQSRPLSQDTTDVRNLPEVFETSVKIPTQTQQPGLQTRTSKASLTDTDEDTRARTPEFV